MIVSGMDLLANRAKLNLLFSLLRMFSATMLEAVPIGVAIPPIPVPTASAQASGAIETPGKLEKGMDNKKRDCQPKGYEAHSKEAGILDGTRGIRELERSTLTMSSHCVLVQESVIPKIQNGTVSGKDR